MFENGTFATWGCELAHPVFPKNAWSSVRHPWLSHLKKRWILSWGKGAEGWIHLPLPPPLLDELIHVPREWPISLLTFLRFQLQLSFLRHLRWLWLFTWRESSQFYISRGTDSAEREPSEATLSLGCYRASFRVIIGLRGSWASD